MWRSIRFPARLNAIVEEMQSLMNSDEFTEALIYILIDWEKTRYLIEKRRLMEQAELRFALLQNLTKKREEERLV